MWLEGRDVIASVFVEWLGAQGKGRGQANGKRIVRLVVGRFYQGYIYSFKRGGKRQGGPQVCQREGRAEPPEEGAFGLYAAVYPLCVVVGVVAAGYVLVHAALRHGFYLVHSKAFGGDPSGVRPHSREFDGVAVRSQGSSHDQWSDGVGQAVAVKKKSRQGTRGAADP